MSARSAILVEEGHFSLAIQDIDKSLESKDKDYKLLERKAQCLLSLDNLDEALETAKEALEALTASGMKAGRLKSKQDQLNKLIKSIITKKKSIVNEGSNINREANLALSLEEPNKSFPNLSNALEIVYSKDRGRYCIAKSDIPCGTLIAVEQPYAWMLDKAESKALCWHCFEPLIAPLPCSECSGVLFCGQKCKYLYHLSYKFNFRYMRGLISYTFYIILYFTQLQFLMINTLLNYCTLNFMQFHKFN